MAIRLLLCDDHDMVRDALGRVLSEEADIEVVASARSVDACLKHLAQNEGKIDVAVIDVRLTDGLGHDITRWIRANQASTRVVLLTSFLEDDLLVEAYSSGADALVLKGAPTRDLTEAIRDVHAGLRLIDAAAARAASQRLQQSNPMPDHWTSSTPSLLLDPKTVEHRWWMPFWLKPTSWMKAPTAMQRNTRKEHRLHAPVH
jgi:DNA-binding NarL/FixJ family response regulator